MLNGSTNALAVGLTFCGSLLLAFAGRSGAALPALVLLGIGFAAVFPILLGVVGDLYPGLTGTAFSLVFVMALMGNTCVPYEDASVPLKNHKDKIGPLSTLGFVSAVWMTVATVAELPAERDVRLYIHPSHNVPGDSTSRERLDEALAEYKRRIAGV